MSTPELDKANAELLLPLPVSAYVNVSLLSTSNPEKIPIVVPVGVFSLCELLLKVKPYGVSLTSTMSTVNSLVFVNPPLSVTLTYKVYKLFTSWLKTSALDNTPPLVNEKELLSG